MEESVKKYSMYSPLVLAYIGDSVFDIRMRDYMVRHHNMQVEKLHKRISAIVCARNQAAFVDKYLETFSEEEQAIYNRGRNAAVHTKAKNASMAEYKKATGLEAVFGYLHLIEAKDRLDELVELVLREAGEFNES